MKSLRDKVGKCQEDSDSFPGKDLMDINGSNAKTNAFQRCKEGTLDDCSNDNKLAELGIKRQLLIDYLLKMGFYINDGIKYGLDLLVYTDHPDKVHSKYGLVIERSFTYQELILLQRVCNSNNKILVIAFFEDKNLISSAIKFIQCERFIAQKYL